MNLKFILGSTLLVAGFAMAVPTLHVESLTLEKTTIRAKTGPQRGLSMSQVEQRFGTPEAKLPPAGGDTALHPVINRWQYDGFTVYFERNIVIHSVRDGI